MGLEKQRIWFTVLLILKFKFDAVKTTRRQESIDKIEKKAIDFYRLNLHNLILHFPIFRIQRGSNFYIFILEKIYDAKANIDLAFLHF